jgi:RHS repeat-associated protein
VTRSSEKLYMVKGGVTYRILSDQVGSVRLVVNAATGAIAQRIDYDEWGNATYVSGAPDFQPFGFAGGLTDRDTGIVRFGARDYDPRVGRWTSKDPISFAGGFALYGYAAGDPVQFVDPIGANPFLAFAMGVGALTGGLNAAFAAKTAGASAMDTALAFAGGAAVGSLAGALGFATPLGLSAPLLGGSIGFGAGFLGSWLGQAFGDCAFNVNQALVAGGLSAAAGFLGGAFPTLAAEAEFAGGLRAAALSSNVDAAIGAGFTAVSDLAFTFSTSLMSGTSQ